MTTYFTDREGLSHTATTDEISEIAWAGIRASIERRVNQNYFASSYPETCSDNSTNIIGTNENAMRDAIRAEIQELPTWPWRQSPATIEPPPTTPAILDMLDFCSRHAAAPEPCGHHKFYDHQHLRFDVARGQHEFREEINLIFRRNGIAYRLNGEHQVQRLTERVFREVLEDLPFHTGEAELDRMLRTAQTKFLHRKAEVHPEALEALWNAWERLKTLSPGRDKRAQAAALLNDAAGPSAPKYLLLLQNEARELTRIGNAMQIRHSETDQERLGPAEHLDYVFYRMWAFLSMILRRTGRPASSNDGPGAGEPDTAANLADTPAFPGYEDDDIPF